MRILKCVGRFARLTGLAAALLPPIAPVTGAQTTPPTITVVNMIPSLWANETTQNSEPTVATNALAPRFVAASAFASGLHFCASATSAPLFVSTDDGNTWSLACVLPTDVSNWPMDMTVRVSADGKSLYAGAAQFYSDGSMTTHAYGWSSGATTIDVLFRTTPGDFSSLISSTLFTRDRTDQPQIRTSPAGTTNEMLWSGENRPTIAGTPGDACNYVPVVWAANPWGSTPPTIDCLSEDRPPLFTVPASRAATAGGKAYVVMYRPVMTGYFNDVVVYRRDGAHFDALTDGPPASLEPSHPIVSDCKNHDGLLGFRVVMCVPYAQPSTTNDFGQERRLNTELAIAVDPANPLRVFIAWAQQSATTPTHPQLHFASSSDGGSTWNLPVWSPDHATNPALAIASDGAVGIMYQQYIPATRQWTTKFALSQNSLTTEPALFTLASVDATSPTSAGDPYLGDYIHLDANGKSFYGVFSASNDLRRGRGDFPFLCPLTLCPSQRPYKNGLPVNSKQKPVGISIDPYFVRVARQ
jgi:hypothetical protein